MAHKDIKKEVVDRIVAEMEKGKIPWRKSWSASGLAPHNPVSGTGYKGVNRILLGMSEFTDPRWLTFKQASASEWKIKKGEHGTQIVAVGEWDKKTKDEAGLEVVSKEKYLKYFTVFNAEQIDGMPSLTAPTKPFQNLDRVEGITAAMLANGLSLDHGGERAFYRPSTDSVRMPPKHTFKDEASYYGTLLHEIGHATGHQSRLNRDLSAGFGTPSYAKEELRAELASAMLSAETGVSMSSETYEQHAGYLQSWIKALKDNKAEIFIAVKDAEKIHDFILEKEAAHKLTVEATAAKTIEQIAKETPLVALTDFKDKLTPQAVAEAVKADPMAFGLVPDRWVDEKLVSLVMDSEKFKTSEVLRTTVADKLQSVANGFGKTKETALER